MGGYCTLGGRPSKAELERARRVREMVPPRPVMCLVFGRRFGVAARAFSLKGYVRVYLVSKVCRL